MPKPNFPISLCELGHVQVHQGEENEKNKYVPTYTVVSCSCQARHAYCLVELFYLNSSQVSYVTNVLLHVFGNRV